jgi:hypothetical protein
MNKKVGICLAAFFSLIFNGCALDTRGGAFDMQPDGPDATSDQSSPDVKTDIDSDAGPWPETGTPDADASPDVVEDVAPDVPIDSPPDVTPEADAPVDSPPDVVEEDSPLDAPDDVVEDVVQEDSPADAPIEAPIDAPDDVVEADAPDPTLCFGVPSESGNIMICAEFPGGTSKSIMIKAEILSTTSSHVIPEKPVCWSEVGVAELACFPCPGPNLCWPIPGGGFPHVQAHVGDKIRFQPGIANGPGLDMINTMCDIGECQSGRYIVYSGHTEVCRVEPNGDITGVATANAHYDGSGTDIWIVCTF